MQAVVESAPYLLGSAVPQEEVLGLESPPRPPIPSPQELPSLQPLGHAPEEQQVALLQAPGDPGVPGPAAEEARQEAGGGVEAELTEGQEGGRMDGPLQGGWGRGDPVEGVVLAVGGWG